VADPIDPANTDERPWFTPGVRGIGIASFLSDVGHEVPTSLLPSLLTSTLGAPASALGLIEGRRWGLHHHSGPLLDHRRRHLGVAGGPLAGGSVDGAWVASAVS
jgi:hypothetical protein